MKNFKRVTSEFQYLKTLPCFSQTVYINELSRSEIKEIIRSNASELLDSYHRELLHQELADILLQMLSRYCMSVNDICNLFARDRMPYFDTLNWAELLELCISRPIIASIYLDSESIEEFSKKATKQDLKELLIKIFS